MIEIGSRQRSQPPPPHIVFEALTNPDEDARRPWLTLHDDEQRPRVIRAEPPSLLIWSSLWIKRPDATVRFDLAPGHGGTALRWTLFVDEPVPDDALVGHMRKRLNQLINATCAIGSASEQSARSPRGHGAYRCTVALLMCAVLPKSGRCRLSR